MLKDITLLITPQMAKDAQENEKRVLAGHLGTHFDVMNKEFPLEYTRRKAYVFDVSAVRDREIGIGDVDLEKVKADMFIAFYTGWIEEERYGSEAYHKVHPSLSDELIDALLERKISIIGIDCAGIKTGKRHPETDQYCADRGVFIVENLCGLKEIVGSCVINTYPMNYAGMSGLPCRVIAEV